MNSSLAGVWQRRKLCWSAVPPLVLAGISPSVGAAHCEAQRDTEGRFGRQMGSKGGDGERSKPHTWKTKLAVNSVLLSPSNLSRFVPMPRRFIFSGALPQASRVRWRFYSLCKFSAARSAKRLAFQRDPITWNDLTVSHGAGNSSSFSCLFLSKSSFNLTVI